MMSLTYTKDGAGQRIVVFKNPNIIVPVIFNRVTPRYRPDWFRQLFGPVDDVTGAIQHSRVNERITSYLMYGEM